MTPPAVNKLAGRMWEESWTNIKTVVDVVHEPVIILDRELRVMKANESFYRVFQVEPKVNENKVIYELGNGQWNIPSLRKLLEDILPNNTFFKGFEVTHEFPYIGHKVMILNARQIHFQVDSHTQPVSPIILLAIEDVTEMMAVAETLANHANKIEASFTDQAKKLKDYINKLEQENYKLKHKQ